MKHDDQEQQTFMLTAVIFIATVLILWWIS